jgi:hypothetical protein
MAREPKSRTAPGWKPRARRPASYFDSVAGWSPDAVRMESTNGATVGTIGSGTSTSTRRSLADSAPFPRAIVVRSTAISPAESPSMARRYSCRRVRTLNSGTSGRRPAASFARVLTGPAAAASADASRPVSGSVNSSRRRSPSCPSVSDFSVASATPAFRRTRSEYPARYRRQSSVSRYVSTMVLSSPS